MNKKDIQKVFKKYIEHSNREDEVYHLRSNLSNVAEVENAVEELELHLSDYTEALGLNQFEEFEEDAAFFIDEHFPNHRLSPTTDRYRILVREYLKATAQCIQISIKRLRGDYFDEKSCDWMPTHLGEIDGIKTDANIASPYQKPLGRPKALWDAIKDKLKKIHAAGETEGQSRSAVSMRLAEWYGKHSDRSIAPDTIRKELKSEFDNLGFKSPTG